MKDLEKTKVGFVSVTQRFSTADSIGRLTLNMLMSFAEFEREMISERTRDKVAAARRRGKWTGGTVPLGYNVRDHKLVVNTSETWLVRHVFERYLALQSTMKVVHELNAAGYRTKARKRENAPTKHSSPWSVSAVTRVLRSPIYAGFIGIGNERYPGEHKGIIDVDVFDRAGRILDSHGPQRSATRGRNPAYLLRGLVRCGRCGKPYVASSTRKRGQEYRYYRCETRDKLGKGACGSRALPAEAIEGFVLDKLREGLRDDDVSAGVLDELGHRIELRLQSLAAQSRTIPREVADLATEGRRLLASMEEALEVDRRLLDRRFRDVHEKLGDAEARLAEVERQRAVLDRAAVTRKSVSTLLADFDSMWEVMTLDNRARLVRVLIERIDIDGATGDVAITLADLATSLLDECEGGDEEEEAVCETLEIGAQ
jgi:hypothetical protein